MGSSADSCDSETTVTSFGEDHVTPTVQDQPYFNESEEESRAPVEKGKAKVAALVADKRNTDSQDSPQGETAENTESKESPRDPGDPENAAVEEAGELPREGSEDSDVERGGGCEFPQYTTHHILKSLTSIEAQCSAVSSEKKTGFPSSAERVNTALQRAQMKVCNLSAQRVGRSLIKSKDLLKQRYLLAKAGYPLRRSQSLPTTLLSPVRVVSSVNVRLSPGKETRCSPPSFTYKYTPEEEQELEKQVTEHDGQSVVKSTIFIPPSSVKKEEAPQSEATRPEECPHGRLPPCPQFAPISQSTCSLHSAHEWQDRPLCEHMRTLSAHSVPNISGTSCSSFSSPFGCPYSHRHAAHLYRACPVNPPSAIEMQLRRVLHDIRNSLQNLSQVRKESFILYCSTFFLSHQEVRTEQTNHLSLPSYLPELISTCSLGRTPVLWGKAVTNPEQFLSVLTASSVRGGTVSWCLPLASPSFSLSATSGCPVKSIPSLSSSSLPFGSVIPNFQSLLIGSAGTMFSWFL